MVFLQSIFAIADSHEIESDHTIINSSQNFNHQYHEDSQLIEQDSHSPFSTSLFDENSSNTHQECHHGHCHHGSIVFIVKENSQVLSSLQNDKYAKGQLAFLSPYLSSNLRPPINS
jgi:hypothetical protein